MRRFFALGAVLAALPLGAQKINDAAARRNENVYVNRIDTDSLKEANVRLGVNVTIVSQPPVETSQYATEHGRPAGELSVVRPAAAITGLHGELFESLQNSNFNARTFFQVGPVKPSRQNSFGGRFTGNLKRIGALTAAVSDRKIRGMVNGNVLVPLDSERTPLATDPAVRAMVGRFLAAFPDELPNRPDFDARALNTNSPQRIDALTASVRLDRGDFSLFHALDRQTVHAFQLVAGQNPDTEIHGQRTRATWRLLHRDASDISAGFGFTRTKSVLRSEPNAVGPRVRMGYQIEELGPDSQFPIDRAQNSFRSGLVGTWRASSSHTVTWGGDATRTQLNGIETNNSRGVIWFSNNFGRSAIDNLRMGTPTTYEVTLGSMSRGFRNWGANLFAADQWRIHSWLQIYWGVRYNLESSPVEVNGFNRIPYGCDCNNFSPRFSIAWRPANAWVLRTGYTVSFGQILPVTYQQIRYNVPQVPYIQVQNPDLLDPLRGIAAFDPGARSSPTVLSPDMVSPYSHQYNFSVERRIGGAQGALVRVGYVGSRSFKLLDSFVENRAVPVAGIPFNTATVDQRRPDPRYYEVKYIVNFGAAYLDAAQVSVEMPSTRGLVAGASYTFGKALDTGSDFAGTAANRDLARTRSQSEFDAAHDKKGLSNFDSTHSVLLYYSYELPKIGSKTRWWGSVVDGWQLSGSTLLKSGTPLTLFVGSDAPGFGNVDGGPSDRPNIVDPSILGMTIGNPDTAPLILRRDRFAYISPGEMRGNLGRNTFRKGGIANCNAAISKQWRAGGRAVILRGEAFNLTNTPQFDEPQRNLSSPAFGKITNTLNDGRVLQLGIRLVM